MQCRTDPKAGCGQDGTCDGKGACKLYSLGTVCTPGTCQGAEITGTLVCDGSGACRPGPISVCAPFVCSKTTNQCKATCSSDADCVSPVKCLGGSCGPKGIGASCGADAECDSKHCADGVCCSTACGGACQSCDMVGLVGTCTPTPAGQPHPRCLKQDPTTCGMTGMCDGQGGCPLYPVNTACGAAVCVDGTSGKSTQTCDGLGTCLAAKTFSCGNFACARGACTESCSSQADCAPGHTCTIPTGSSVGTCGLKVPGQSCTADADCVSAHCADGVCCATTCTGACRSCAIPGSLGTCTSIAAGGADPHAVCKDLTAAMCGTDGKCDGAGACRKYAAGTVCAPESCSGSSYTPRSTCSTAGTCVRPNATRCGPYQCNGTACYTACTIDMQCVSPNTCGMNGVAGSCGTKPNGQPCSNSSQCTSGQCAQGVCCGTVCNTACHACNIAGSLGTCVGITASSDPQGMCALQAQSGCGTTGQCTSGQCAKWPSGTQCKAATCSNGNPTTTLTPAAKCDGAGNCATGATMSCPGICTNGGCGFQVQGGVCGATSQCASGLTCVSGVCCNSACTGACSSCNLAGKVGTCSPVAAGPICRAKNGDCDVAETCNGTSLDCPANAIASSSTVCRASAGACDVAETCTGPRRPARPTCCAPATTVCRASAGACDVAESCTGPRRPARPTRFAPSATICRASAGVCDVAESCTGARGLPGGRASRRRRRCAARRRARATWRRAARAAARRARRTRFASAATVCRASAGLRRGGELHRDVGGLPGGRLRAGGDGVPRVGRRVRRGGELHGPSAAARRTRSRRRRRCAAASAGVCDVAESCTGSRAACPADGFVPAGTVCRASAGVCDVAESCTGCAAACPADGFASTSVVCSPASCSADNMTGSPSNCGCEAPSVPRRRRPPARARCAIR